MNDDAALPKYGRGICSVCRQDRYLSYGRCGVCASKSRGKDPMKSTYHKIEKARQRAREIRGQER